MENRPSEALVPTAPAAAASGSSPAAPSPLQGIRLLDVSAGVGLVSIGAASAGAIVTATDIPSQIPLLQSNVDAATDLIASTSTGGSIRVASLLWGTDAASLRGPGEPAWDIGLLSDVLFIALRDGLQAELTATLTNLVLHCNAVMFGFEERLIADETEFMVGLQSLLNVQEYEWVEAKKEGMWPLVHCCYPLTRFIFQHCMSTRAFDAFPCAVTVCLYQLIQLY